MTFFGLIGGAAVVVGATAIAGKYLYDRISEAESRMQMEMRREHDAYCSERRSRYESTYCGYQRSYDSRRDSYNRELDEEYRRKIEQLKQHNRPYITNIQNHLKEQRTSTAEDLKQLQELLNQWNQNKQNVQNTMLRMKAMKRTILAIEEAAYKIQAYLCYLDRYEQNMLHQFEHDGSVPDPFEMTLPAYYPYPGKIFKLLKSDFYLRNGNYYYAVKDEKNLFFMLSKFEIEQFKSCTQDVISFMVCYNKKKPDTLSTILSMNQADVKLSLNSTDGISAEVEDINNNWIILSYHGMRLSLSRFNLINTSRSLPKGSFVTVFLTDYDFAFKSFPQVSEKWQDSLTLASFENVGMLLNQEQYETLFKHLRSNHWLDCEDEWRIGPFDTNEMPLKFVKLQMGNYYGYLASFEPYEDSSDKMVLVYHRMLEKDEMLSFTDIFAAADVTIECYVPGKTNLQNLAEEGAYLYSYLNSEFASQSRILRSSPMAQYFDKWTELTKRLISVLQYQKRCSFQIRSWQPHNNGMILYSADNSLKEFLGINRSYSPKFKPIYFFPVLEGKEYLKCYVDETEESDEVEIFVPKLSEEKFNTNLKLDTELVLFTNAGAEKSQLSAFSEFREGHITSLNMKEIILHIQDLDYHDTKMRIEAFYNKGILQNPPQFKALNRAFSVQDYYMIQGPPGTGKTTVIKELIMQQLHHEPSSRILIVSQANVAVDNVLRGIQQLCRTETCVSESQIIRCGSDDRIADDLKHFSYKGRMSSYIDTLKSAPSINPVLRQKWISFSEDDETRDIVNNCLLRGFQIIGATCVGFANRNIGLSGMEFDLVIIDEAGKALPGELLIPINHAKKLLLIGDHKQLPPVVNPEFYQSGAVQTEDILDEDERLDFFNDSFFKRLWDNCPDSNKCTLQTQFRMPPVIAGLVNLFYDGNLKTGSICYTKMPLAFDSNLVMLDMKNENAYKEQQKPKTGPYNKIELEVVAELIKQLRLVYPFNNRIVVITPYKTQKRELIRHMKDIEIENVTVNTIDAFQGDEEDIVIYCMTRAVKKTNYFSDAARLNVAFSRAKNLLIIIGSSAYLQSYGKEHILYQVYTYLTENGRMLLYEDFKDNPHVVQNLESHIPQETCAPDTDPIPDLITLFQEEKSVSTPATAKCVRCHAELEGEEKVLCVSCLDGSEIRTCKSCQNEFNYPNYLRYIEKKAPPVYCPDCSEEVLNRCRCCRKDFYIQKFLLKSERQGPYCEECAATESVCCANCNEVFETPHFKVLQNKHSRYQNYCPDCWKKIKIVCSNCGTEFFTEKWRYQTVTRKGGQLLCKRCFDHRRE